jgi:hypothetical protein
MAVALFFERTKALEHEKRIAPMVHAPPRARMNLGDDMVEKEQWDREDDVEDEKAEPIPPLDANDPILLPDEQPPHWIYGMMKKEGKKKGKDMTARS